MSPFLPHVVATLWKVSEYGAVASCQANHCPVLGRKTTMSLVPSPSKSVRKCCGHADVLTLAEPIVALPLSFTFSVTSMATAQGGVPSVDGVLSERLLARAK